MGRRLRKLLPTIILDSLIYNRSLGTSFARRSNAHDNSNFDGSFPEFNNLLELNLRSVAMKKKKNIHFPKDVKMIRLSPSFLKCQLRSIMMDA